MRGSWARRARTGAAVVAAFAPLSGCGGGPTPAADGPSCAADDVRAGAPIYYGTTQPVYAPLTPGQVLAVGAWTEAGPGPGYCTGTLVAAAWVVTAAHCEVAVGHTFCLGEQTDTATCIAAAAVDSRPIVVLGGQPVTLDLAMVRLADDAAARLPGVEPIPILVDDLDATWIGQTVETAGYGRTESGTAGARRFAAEVIDAVSGPLLTVDGMGLRGTCSGDSGGPALVIDGGGTARVAGALSGGDPSCVDRDDFTRVDVARAWIELLAGPAPSPGNPCGPIDEVGRCSAGHALYCAGGALVNQTCPAQQPCGWDGGAGGYRCTSGPDPCGGVDQIGACGGGVARWCEDGVARARDCACRGERCIVDPGAGGAYCVADPCMGLDFLGRCDGDVARWCDGGRVQARDCAATGQVCRYVDGDLGYYCTDP